MSIRLNVLQLVSQNYDLDRNGELNRPETAKASVGLFSQGATNEGRLLARFVQGGTDRQGLFPDFDNSGGISFNEIAQLAASGGARRSNVVDTRDFSTVFGNRFNRSRDRVDFFALNDLAQQALPLENPYAGPAAPPEPPVVYADQSNPQPTPPPAADVTPTPPATEAPVTEPPVSEPPPAPPVTEAPGNDVQPAVPPVVPADGQADTYLAPQPPVPAPWFFLFQFFGFYG